MRICGFDTIAIIIEITWKGKIMYKKAMRDMIASAISGFALGGAITALIFKILWKV